MNDRGAAAVCPEGSPGGSFVEYLNQAGTVALADNTFIVALMADDGMMTCVAIP
jgi:hypothetical protein